MYGNKKFSLILIFILVFCSLTVFIIPNVLGYTGTITYSNNIITVVGGTNSAPIMFSDIYAADIANGWGKVALQGTAQYQLNCKIVIGNGATLTFFNDTLKEIYLIYVPSTSFENYFEVTNNATLTFGKLIGYRETSLGCAIFKTSTPNNSSILIRNTGSNSKTYLYGCQFSSESSAESSIWNQVGGFICIYNSIFYNINVRGGSGSWDLYRLTLNSYYYPMNCMENGVFEDIYIYGANNGVYTQANQQLVLKNCIIKDCSNANILCYQLTTPKYFINCVMDNWSFNWGTGNTAVIYRQNTFDLIVMNGNLSDFINNANVSLTQNNVKLGSWLTNSSGQIPEQILNYGWYNQTYGNTMQGAYNITLTINANNYGNYTSIFYPYSPISWTISLNSEIPITATDNVVLNGYTYYGNYGLFHTGTYILPTSSPIPEETSTPEFMDGLIIGIIVAIAISLLFVILWSSKKR
jgi:hypothetical protein